MDSDLAMIYFFAGNFAPRGFASCEGQLLSIAQNTAVFSLLGTTYGGNGQTTFALPDLRGRSPVGQGQGPGLSPIVEGQTGGSETVTLTVNQLPAHSHTFTDANSTLKSLDTKATAQIATAGAMLARAADGGGVSAQPRIYVPAGTAGTAVELAGVVAKGTIGNTGGNQPVAIRSPYLGLFAIICLEGIFPSRN